MLSKLKRENQEADIIVDLALRDLVQSSQHNLHGGQLPSAQQRSVYTHLEDP